MMEQEPTGEPPSKKPTTVGGIRGNRCVVGGCSNTTQDGFSIFTMPSKPKPLKSAWIQFIKSTREFQAKDYVKVSVCSGHFTIDQFDPSHTMKYKMGFRKYPPAMLPKSVPKLKHAINPFPPEFFDRQPGSTTSSSTTPVSAPATFTPMAALETESHHHAHSSPGPSTSMTSTSSSSATSSTFSEPPDLASPILTVLTPSTCSTTTMTTCTTTSTSAIRTCSSTSYSTSTVTVTSVVASASSSGPASSMAITPMPASKATSSTQSASRSDRKRKSTHIHKKEVKEIEEEYARKAAEEQLQQTIATSEENDKGIQASVQTVSHHVQATVRKHSCGVRVSPRTFVRSKGTQTQGMKKVMVLSNGNELVNATTQTDKPADPPADTPEQPVGPAALIKPGIADDEEPEEPEDVDRDDDDPTWKPDSNGSDSSDGECSNSEDILTYDNPRDEPKYIVFETCLFSLFKTCPLCKAPCDIQKFRPKSFGSQLKVTATCKLCAYQNDWYSQPKIGSRYAGNVLLSAAILFAGASPTQAIKVLTHMNLQGISNNTFLEHQRVFLQPAIIRVWARQQNHMFNAVKNDNRAITLGGDGRSDSPGHCAKYGSYSLMDLDSGKVLDLQMIQSTEVTSSNAMELAGLKLSIGKIKDAGIQVGTLVTDRHPSVAKYMREQHSDVDHRYDVWHIAKGIKKNIKAIAKQKDCENAGLWQRSIVNHVYWSATSTPDGNPDVIQTKYKSILNHMQNVHVGHGHELYDTCAHGVLDRPRVWLKPDSKVFDRLSEVILKTRLLNDIKKMSPLAQTSNLEAYHSVLLYWCPKMLSFSYQGMKCRLILSALHWNENGQRQQAEKADGTPLIKVSYPKPVGGRYTVTKVLKAPTFGYVNELMAEAILTVKTGDKDLGKTMPELKAPAPLSAQYAHPSKDEALAAYNKHRRFASTEK